MGNVSIFFAMIVALHLKCNLNTICWWHNYNIPWHVAFGGWGRGDASIPTAVCECWWAAFWFPIGLKDIIGLQGCWPARLTWEPSILFNSAWWCGEQMMLVVSRLCRVPLFMIVWLFNVPCAPNCPSTISADGGQCWKWWVICVIGVWGGELNIIVPEIPSPLFTSSPDKPCLEPLVGVGPAVQIVINASYLSSQ